jgi:hypothetical protein
VSSWSHEQSQIDAAMKQEGDAFVDDVQYLHGFGEGKPCRVHVGSLFNGLMDAMHDPCAITTILMTDATAGNEFQSEALPGALPHGQNNPRVRNLPIAASTIGTTMLRCMHRASLWRMVSLVV